MENDTLILVYILGIITSIVIYYFFNRFVFSINKKLKNQEMMIFLLKEIAKKHGVDNEKIELAEGIIYGSTKS